MVSLEYFILIVFEIIFIIFSKYLLIDLLIGGNVGFVVIWGLEGFGLFSILYFLYFFGGIFFFLVVVLFVMLFDNDESNIFISKNSNVIFINIMNEVSVNMINLINGL